MNQPPVLECQDCGDVVRELSAAEAQRVANRPYDFVVYCGPCQADRDKEASRRARREATGTSM